MDPRHPTTHIIHPTIDGYHLENEKAWASQPFKFWPYQFFNGGICLVVFIAIIAACWAADKAMGIPA
jgi:hypothetical protein